MPPSNHSKKILAIDCSFGGHSVAIAQHGQVLAESHHPRITATRGLIASIDQTLRRLDLQMGDIGCMAFGAGPGLFSGIRSACTAAQGLAFVNQLKVVPVPTTVALAQLHCRRRALIAYPAHRGHCYLATLERHGTCWRATLGPYLFALDDLPRLRGDWELCGRQLRKLHGKLRHAVTGDLGKPLSHRASLAGTVAVLGLRQYAQGKGIRPEHARPDYVRVKVAYTKMERLQMRVGQ